MTAQKLSYSIFSAAGIIVLILDSHTALIGASEGISLCIKTVIPSLFPFIFLCSVLTYALWGESFPLLKFIGHAIGIPAGGESLLISAVLGGYPAGAQAVASAYCDKRLSRSEATRLLSFCSNAGPAFLFGILPLQFPNITTVWVLWSIQILSMLVTGLIYYRPATGTADLAHSSVSMSKSLAQTVKAMSLICGWIILFQILTQFIEQWFLWYFPTVIQVIITGLLELSSGCCILTNIASVSLRFLVCTVFLSFGGICVTLQTASVIGNLPLKAYLQGKLTQTLISFTIALLYLAIGWTAIAISVLGVVSILIFRKKDVDFCKCPMYNECIIIGRKHNDAVS